MNSYPDETLPSVEGDLDPISEQQILMLRTFNSGMNDPRDYYYSSYRKATQDQVETVLALGKVPIFGQAADYLTGFSSFDPDRDITMLHVLTHAYGLIKTSQGAPLWFGGFDEEGQSLFSQVRDGHIIRTPIQSLNPYLMQYIHRDFSKDMAIKLIEMYTAQITR